MAVADMLANHRPILGLHLAHCRVYSAWVGFLVCSMSSLPNSLATAALRNLAAVIRVKAEDAKGKLLQHGAQHRH